LLAFEKSHFGFAARRPATALARWDDISDSVIIKSIRGDVFRVGGFLLAF
jgi:hypothetical protein